jgi:hypothetical protein
MINNKFIKIVNGLNNKVCCVSKNPELKDYDMFFRGEDEIPHDYKWDIRGEYLGWLQYRWGDGKNAIGYTSEPKIKNKNKDIEEEYDYEGNFEGYLPCTLEEELSGSEYINAGNTLDKKETTSSIADILGEDNPLLKLKFD